MNGDRLLLERQAAHPAPAGQPMDTGTRQAGSGSPRGSRALSTRASEALADKEARRICIRQLSTAELDHEEKVIAKQLAILHGTLADIRRERKYRRSLRG